MLYAPYTILIILSIAMVLFVSGIWRYDIVALLALAVGVLSGAVPFKQVYSGLSNPAVITVACVMIISQAIHRSGSVSYLVSKLSSVTKSPTLHVASLSFIAATLSGFMNNVGALALMMPVTIQTAVNSKRSPSLLLLPIALASALGGLLTVIGTPPNLLISAYRQQLVGQPFSMFDFFHVGFFVAIVGVIFIAILGWRLLPARRKASKSTEDLFHMQDYLIETKVLSKSTINHKMAKELDAILKTDYILVGIIRKKRKRFTISPEQLIEENDILIIEASPKNLEKIIKNGRLEIVGQISKGADILQEHEASTIEATIPPGSKVIGRSASSMRLRARYSVNLIAVSRSGKPFRERLHDVNLRAGDVVLLNGPAESLRHNVTELGLLPLVERNINIGRKNRQWLPPIIFLIAILLASTQWLPVQVAFGGAVLALVITRATPARLLYDGIEWSVIILLAAMIPLGQALQTTGGTALISNAILDISKQVSPVFILAIVFLVTMTLSDFMNNAATTVVMAPIAASIAQGLHANVDPFLMTVAIAASCSFLTPVGHQNNTIVMGPGGYKFIDYIRIGLPLEILVFLVAMPTLLWMWPM